MTILAMLNQYQYTITTIIFNIICSTGIIFVNKWIMRVYQFPYAMLLTGLHFSFCGLALELAIRFNLMQPYSGKVSSYDKYMLAFFGVGTIVTMNTSLQFNSVGFYQLSKLACIPCAVLIESIFYNKSFSNPIKITLAILLFGIGLATVTDFELNLLGSVIGIIAVIVTTYTQILTTDTRKNYDGLSNGQLLYILQFPQAIFSFVCSIVFEFLPTPLNLIQYSLFNQTVWEDFSLYAYILLSCVIAVGVNYFTFALLGATSVVTYQVVGHFKTILIFVFGFLLFPPPGLSQVWKNVLGIVIGFTGVVLYAYQKHIESNNAKNTLVVDPVSKANTVANQLIQVTTKEISAEKVQV